MNPGKDGHDSVSPPPGRWRSFLVPILFFIMGGLSTFGYLQWNSIQKGSGEAEPAKIVATQTALPSEKKEPRILYYVDPMNPSNKTDKPGKAPCGMDMVPVYDDSPGPDSLPQGTVKLSPEKQQLIGVQLGEASEAPLSRTVRAVGRATYDETRIHHIHTRVAGWVDKVYVDFTGKLVKKGQPLLSIYSPELVSTQQELLVAKKSSEILQKNQFEGIGSQSTSLYKSTRERLKLWDISDQQISEIERQGTPIRSLTINSHSDGYVIARNVFAGHQVNPELELYTIADLSNIWIIAEIYEYEIAAIHLGQTAVVTFSSFPGKVFTGKVTYISPELDAKTRAARIRIEFPNADFLIKPDMFANVELKVTYGKSLSIPQEAVLDSGTSQVVFVAREGGYFEPRRITLGPKVDDRFIVLAGIKPGERVVTSANFLIDSESQLKSATGLMASDAWEAPVPEHADPVQGAGDETGGGQRTKPSDQPKASPKSPGHVH
ncbi:MAG: efflux RND transporter periplasmic adaptor subunit [Syntrophobacter sp.]